VDHRVFGADLLVVFFAFVLFAAFVVFLAVVFLPFVVFLVLEVFAVLVVFLVFFPAPPAFVPDVPPFDLERGGRSAGAGADVGAVAPFSSAVRLSNRARFSST
jgi:hypothetical protein